MTPRSHFDLVDLVLFGLGVLGLVLFGWLLPAQHPNSAATYALGREAAVEQAGTFLSQQGYSTEGLIPQARLMRATRLLDSLQATLGRPQAIRMLKAGGDAELPAYYWNVRWQRAESVSPFVARGAGAPERRVFEVDLTQDGAVWQFRNPQAVIPRGGVDRDVLRTLLGAETEMGDRLMAPPDSALGALLYFDLPVPSVPPDSLTPLRVDQDQLHEAATTGLPQGLGATAAAAIAREHLRATMLGELPLAVVSIEALPERGRSAARVHVESEERVHGQHVAAEVDVTAAGALLALDVAFNETHRDSEHEMVIYFGSNRVRGGVNGVGYVVLMLLLLVVMFRRLSARALDARAAIKDALLAGGAMAAGSVLAVPMWAGEMGGGWSLWVFVLIGMLFTGAGIGVLVFVASAASDSLARAAWPQQIETLSLARQGAFVNQPVGRALVRAVAVAGVLLGAQVVVLAAAPSGEIAFEMPLLGEEETYSVFGASVAEGVWYALLLTLVVYVGLGATLRRWRAGFVWPGLVLALGVLGFEALDLPVGPPWLTWGAPLIVGGVLAWVYVRYDALTVLVAVFVTGLLWDTSEGWLVAASPAFADAVLGAVLTACIAVVGFVGVRSARTGETLPRYVPDYVAEQRERGRLARELEIAREVQRSFLPARMPETAGLDIAARCIAAEEVGGDYYDVIPLGGGRLALVIGDVSGKGIQAAFFMTLAKGFLQSLARETGSPAEVLRRANRLFVANASRGTFISLIYGIFDLEAQMFTFARAGHNPVILKRSPNQTADFVQPPGLAIGLTDRAVFDDVIREQTIPLRRGDTLVFYTDGFSEAMDPGKTLYTDERLAEAVAATRGDTSAEDLLQAMVTDVLAHAGSAPQHDDMTMVVVRVGALAKRDGQQPVSSVSVITS